MVLTGGKDGKGGEGRRKVVGAPGQGVWEAIAGPLAVADGGVEGSEGDGPPGMATRGGASLAKVFQVLVVAEHPNRVSSPIHIHPPLSECLHHCQQLFIIFRVV